MKEKPLWSICLICKDEASVLPRAIESLKEFQARGGSVTAVDTGSTDRSVEIMRAAGFQVHLAGDRFLTKLDQETADKLNQRFIVDEKPALKAGDTFFDFSTARNYCTSLAENDICSWIDCDEAFTVLDIDKVNESIREGYEAFTYDFVYAHFPDGTPSVQFRQSKMHDRRKQKWVNCVHEVLSGEAKTTYLPPEVMKLEHFQNTASNRSGYLRGLMWDCYQNPDNDRNKHYLAREFYYGARWKSAIRLFEEHAAMGRWPAEAAQSLNFAGTCWERLEAPEKAVETWNRAIATDATRREPFILLAQFYLKRKDYLRAYLYANMALQLPLVDYYANDLSHYREVPEHIAYVSLYWLGRKEEAKEHFDKALAFSPENEKIRSDRQFFY